MLEHRVVRDIGGMTIRELGRRMDYSELVSHAAFYKIERERQEEARLDAHTQAAADRAARR